MADTKQDLWNAIVADDGNRVSELLQGDPALAGAEGQDGVSAIMTALYRRRTAALAALLAARPPLSFFEAAATGDTERLRLLLPEGGAVDARSVDGFTGLHLAAYFGQPVAIEFLLGHGADVHAVAENPMRVMPLHSAVSAGPIESVRLLLEHGAPVNARQHAGYVPLHAAAQNGDLETLELLLHHGADRTLKADDGKTATDFARAAGHQATLERLERV
jgi:ankyrin repeat protein